MRLPFLFISILFSDSMSAQTITYQDIVGKWMQEGYTTVIWEFKDDHSLSIYGFGADQLWKSE